MKKVLAGFLWLSASLFSVDSNAAYLRCDGCSTSAMRSKAISAGFGTHYVADFRSGNVLGYMHAHPRAGGGRDIAVPGDAQDVADLMAEIYQATSGSLEKTITVYSDTLGIDGLGGATAYDFVDDWPLRSRVQSHLWANFPTLGSPNGAWSYILGNIDSLLATLSPAIGWIESFRLNIKLVFTDGSSVQIRADFDSETAEYVPNSARDQHGQGLLEDNARPYAGSYHFPGENGAADFIERAIRMGIPVTGGSSGVRVRCTWDGSTLHCVVSRT